MYRIGSRRFLAILLVLMFTLVFAQTAGVAAELPTPDLTIKDLETMNGGNLAYTLNDQGYVSFLKGNFYDGIIKNGTDAGHALEGVAALLGADENTAFMIDQVIEDDNGYFYFIFFQWHGEEEVAYSVVKVVTDPEGKAVALSSSVTSGEKGNMDAIITPEEALSVAKEHLAKTDPDVKYVYYESETGKTTLSSSDENGILTMDLAYIIYTNNPNGTVEGNDLMYIAHYVSAEGEYLYSIPVSSIGDSYAVSGKTSYRSFEGKTAARYTGTAHTKAGEAVEIDVPVMFDDNADMYYLGDVERNIVMADFWEYQYNNHNVAMLESKDNAAWPDDALIAYNNYITAYDFYASVGWKSVDGFGTPILLLVGYCDPDHNPVDNACYMGFGDGWQIFAATSEINCYNEGLDVIGHEYTHGFTASAMTTVLYENQPGAINESMSDIMGNIMEMLAGKTDDETWLVGENAGGAIRCMTDPNMFTQPAYVGDAYYVPDVAMPSDANDRGGVHKNNSILCAVAPKLYGSGVSLEDQRKLWATFTCMLTPKSTLEDAAVILPFAAEISGLSEYAQNVADAVAEMRIDRADPYAQMKEGCGMVTMKLPEGREAAYSRLLIADPVTRKVALTWTGVGADEMKLQLPCGDYIAMMQFLGGDPEKQGQYDYTEAGWVMGNSDRAKVTIVDGETVELPTEGL